MPGKYGQHGELFFFLIKEELATMPGSETFSPFFTADIRTPSFSSDVLWKCALFALHLKAEEGRGGESGCQAPGSQDAWKFVCPKSPLWVQLGLKTKALLQVILERIMRCTSSSCMGLVTRSLSLFLKE